MTSVELQKSISKVLGVISVEISSFTKSTENKKNKPTDSKSKSSANVPLLVEIVYDLELIGTRNLRDTLLV